MLTTFLVYIYFSVSDTRKYINLAKDMIEKIKQKHNYKLSKIQDVIFE
ncbi:hypothetical protein UT300007_22930 [Clostridium sp. CTA-7]